MKTRVIWKYHMYGNVVDLQLPKGAEILTVQTQRNLPRLWVLVDPTECEIKMRKFIGVETGEELIYDMGRNYKYIDTFQQDAGSYVIHLFEIIKE